MDNTKRFKIKSSPKLEFLRCRATNIALLCVLLVGTFVICRADESAVNKKETPEQDQDQLIREQPNRQFFRVHLMSGSKATNSNKKLFPKVKLARQQPNLSTSSSSSSSSSLDTISSKIKTDLSDQRAGAATDSGSVEPQIKAQTNNKGQEKQSKQLKGTTTISSATLKKLLNQTLLKSSSSSPDSIAGGGNNSGQKTSKNFKFVFIQRATAAPGKSSTSSSPSLTHSNPATTSANEQSASDLSSSKSSLAASVSKQLATSLLNSAASLVADLSSSSSLSSLASQIVAASAAANSIGDSISLKRINSTTSSNTNSLASSSSSSSSSDLSAAESVAETTNKREQQQVNNLSPNEFGASSPSSSAKKSPVATNNNKKATTKSKPSKIYNLPVKFVANGQPNHVVVFHTLREHFATIKRLQAMSSSNGTGGIKSNNSSSIKLTNKERKQQQQQKQRHKLKGANSRLIYLPLRYLSNAKPNKVLINSSSKATHKSSATS